MNGFDGTLVLALMVVARLALPFAITLAFGYVMNRIMDRWQGDL
jgi:hypothetical protein